MSDLTAVDVRKQVQMLHLLRLWSEPGNAGRSFQKLAEEMGVSDDTLYRLVADPNFQALFQLQFQGPMMQALARLGDRLNDVIDRQIGFATGELEATPREQTEAARVLGNLLEVLTRTVRETMPPAVSAIADNDMMSLHVHQVGAHITLQIGRRPVEERVVETSYEFVGASD